MMITDERKHIADILKIAGFALMTPFGKLILKISELNWDDFTVFFFMNIPLACILFYFGVIMIFKSTEYTMDIKETKKWK